MYKVLEYFTDLKDNSFAYEAGDTYPREGYEPSEERIDELATTKNVRHRPLIKLIPEDTSETVDEEEAIVSPEEETEEEESEKIVEESDEKPKKRAKKKD